MQLCPHCHTGRVQLYRVPYVQWHQHNMLIVDRIPALVCDVCGEKAYDPYALETLHHLIWSETKDKSSSVSHSSD